MSADTRSRQPFARMISTGTPEPPADAIGADAAPDPAPDPDKDADIGQSPVASATRRTGANDAAPAPDGPNAPSRASFRHLNS